MKPVKNLETFSKWLLRFAVAAYLLTSYFTVLKTLDFGSANYLINFAFVLSAVCLFIGGFQRGHGTTIVSGIALAVLASYKAYPLVYGINSLFYNSFIYVYLVIIAIAVFFVSKGNG
jgi:hypothetical protein